MCIRDSSQIATMQLRENLGPGFENLQPADLNPKTFIQKQIAGALEDEKPKISVQPKIDPDLV